MSGARTAEVVVVGGGIIGCSIAWHLTREGIRDVVLLEKASLASGATGVCPGGIRQQFQGEADCLWARAAMHFWEHVNERLEPLHDFYFERSGYLFVAHSEATLDGFRANVGVQNRLGIPSEVLTASEIGNLLPALRNGALAGGAFCAEDGFLEDCHGITHLLARRAEERGARVLYEQAAGLRRAGPGWEVETHHRKGGTSGRIHADCVVLAAGNDSVALAAGVGVDLPVQPQRRRLGFTLPYHETVMRPLVVAPEIGFAGKQLTSDGFYVGWLGEDGDEPDLVFTENALRAGAQLVPLFEELPVRRVLAGFYDTTPDRRPVLGGVEGVDGLGLAVGFSGHGFMLAPAVGAALASWATGEEPGLPLDPFALGRFSGGGSPPTGDGQDREGLVI